MILVKFVSAHCSFFVSKRANEQSLKKWAIRSFAHLSWATLANCSQSLICHEWPERFAHSRSFVLIDLSESLTVAHLIWANERMSNEWITNPADLAIWIWYLDICYILNFCIYLDKMISDLIDFLRDLPLPSRNRNMQKPKPISPALR